MIAQHGFACSIAIIGMENVISISSSNSNRVHYVPFHINTLVKGMKPSLLSAMADDAL